MRLGWQTLAGFLSAWLRKWLDSAARSWKSADQSADATQAAPSDQRAAVSFKVTDKLDSAEVHKHSAAFKPNSAE